MMCNSSLGDNTLPTIVLIHGLLGSSISYYKLIQPLAARFRVVLIDLVGMGGSSRPDNFLKDSFTPQ